MRVVSANVYDFLGAATQITDQVQVLFVEITTEALTESISDNLGATNATMNPMEAKAAKKFINAITSVMNTVDCSSISTAYCNTLNREACSTTEATCGNCLE